MFISVFYLYHFTEGWYVVYADSRARRASSALEVTQGTYGDAGHLHMSTFDMRKCGFILLRSLILGSPELARLRLQRRSFSE